MNIFRRNKKDDIVTPEDIKTAFNKSADKIIGDIVHENYMKKHLPFIKKLVDEKCREYLKNDKINASGLKMCNYLGLYIKVFRKDEPMPKDDRHIIHENSLYTTFVYGEKDETLEQILVNALENPHSALYNRLREIKMEEINDKQGQ